MATIVTIIAYFATRRHAYTMRPNTILKSVCEVKIYICIKKKKKQENETKEKRTKQITKNNPATHRTRDM